MSNSRRIRRSAHTAAQRNEWLGLIYVRPEIVDLLAPAGEADPELIKSHVNLMLRAVFDAHYEAVWPQAGPVPYVSVYETIAGNSSGATATANIEMRTWPGERTVVSRVSDTAQQRRARLSPEQFVGREAP